MNKILRYGLLFLSLQVGVWAQQSLSHTSKLELSKDIPTMSLQTPDLTALAAEDAIRDKQGVLYRIGVAIPTHLTTQNSGFWTTTKPRKLLCWVCCWAIPFTCFLVGYRIGWVANPC
jgi:hypothetical protein